MAKGGPGRKPRGAPAQNGELGEIKKLLVSIAQGNDELRDRITALEVAKAGGAVPDVLNRPESSPEASVAYGGDQPDLGPIFLCRVTPANVPVDTTSLQLIHQQGTDRAGKPFIFRRQIVTGRATPLPEDIIKRLKTPKQDEVTVPPQSVVYEAYIRGNLEPAKKQAEERGYDRVVAKGPLLKYVRLTPVFHVDVEGVFQGNILTPTILGVRA